MKCDLLKHLEEHNRIRCYSMIFGVNRLLSVYFSTSNFQCTDFAVQCLHILSSSINPHYLSVLDSAEVRAFAHDCGHNVWYIIFLTHHPYLLFPSCVLLNRFFINNLPSPSTKWSSAVFLVVSERPPSQTGVGCFCLIDKERLEDITRTQSFVIHTIDAPEDF